MGGGSRVGTESFYVYGGYCRPFTEDELGLLRRLLIADAYARFLRARGDSVLFGLGVESFGEPAELEAARRGITPPSLVDEYVGRLLQRIQSLKVSCDWDRTVLSSNREHCLRTQTMFLKLLERDLVYQRNQPNGSAEGATSWVMRTSRFAEQCDLPEHRLLDWTADAVATQRTALGAIDGVEVRAVIPGIGDLVVFTPYADSIAQAAFVSVSPNHPEIEALASTGLVRIQGATGDGTLMATTLQVAVPGVDEPLPLVIASSVDDRFGPTAVIGIPDRDDIDREIAKQLKPPTGMSLGSMRVSSKPSAAKRYRLPDLSIAREAQWGAPVPIMHCQKCGLVPIPAAELPLQSPESAEGPETGDRPSRAEPPERGCPQCDGPAMRDSASIDSNFDSMWMWPSICSPQESESATPSSAGHEGWTTASLVVWGADESDQLLWQRVAGHILNSLSPNEAFDESEPFARVLVHGSLEGEASGVAVENVRDLDEYIARTGCDTARFAILNAGSPGQSTHLYEHLLQHAERFVREVLEQIKTLKTRGRPVPEEIDLSTRSRRRLAAWSGIAAEHVAVHLERLEIHKATYDLMLFHQRILAFESDCLENGGLDDADWDAVAVALVHLGRAAEPIVPELASHIEAIAS